MLARLTRPSAPPARFATIAREVAGRWLAERDTRLAAHEVEAARVFLAAAGVPTTAMADGSFCLGRAARAILSRERLFLLAFRRLNRMP
jgi:hypothetical protein